MSDREIIIRSLEKIERRTRANRLFKELGVGFAVSLILPVGFKVLDLLTPFRAITITIVFGLWLIGLAVFVASRVLKKGTLREAAASIDQKAALHDEIKTAYWFINNPRDSDWVRLQLVRAASDASKVNVNRFYPWVIPQTGYLAVAMVLLLVALNFLPLPWNHNWLYLQAAPAFALTEQEQALLEQSKDLLAEAERLEQSELAQRLEQIMQQLQEGTISTSEALQQLREIQNMLDEGNLDVGSINAGLEEMAKELQQSQQLEETARQMMDKQLMQAAQEMRELAEKMGMQSPEALREMQESLQEASENQRTGLENLSQDLKQASDSLRNQDQLGAQQALERAAQELEDLAQKMQSQQLKNDASQQLRNLEESLRQRQQAGEQQEAAQGQEGQQQASEGQGAQQQQQEGGQSQQGASAAEGQPGQQAQQPGQPGEAQQASSEGQGQMPSGNPSGNAPREGAPTKLDVQLEKEQLTGQHDGGLPQQEIEEASRQERSKLDYRNVQSELSPAQKDLLNQDKIPWQYRPLIRNYFQAIRPRGK